MAARNLPLHHCHITKGHPMLHFLSQTAISDLTNLGAAGVMGAMWLWERQSSHRRDQQLDESHQRIQGDKVQLDQLLQVVANNTQAATRLADAQLQLLQRLGATPAANFLEKL